MNEKQHALAAEIRAEMAAQQIKAVEMQQRTGIKHASWRNWFVTAVRPVPYPELEAVCDVLGVKLSEMLRRAEARAAHARPAGSVETGMTPRERAQLDKARERFEREDDGGGSADPRVALRADEDDGIGRTATA